MNCLFFEVSAKTEENIKKMLYTSIIELPIFDKYRNNKIEDLIDELENSNNANNTLNDSKLNNSGMLESSRNNNNELNINSDRDINSNRRREKCKCWMISLLIINLLNTYFIIFE